MTGSICWTALFTTRPALSGEQWTNNPHNNDSLESCCQDGGEDQLDPNDLQVKTEFHNKSREFYNENEDVAVMMFDINHGYRRCSSIDLIQYMGRRLSDASCQKTQSAENFGGGG